MSDFDRENLLCPLDFSEVSEKAVDCAVELAREWGATLHLLYVAEAMNTAVFIDYEMPAMVELQEEMEKRSRERLNEMANRIEGVEVKVHFRRGKAFREILNAARDLKIDMIVMGTHGRSAISQFFLGKTAERVVRRAPCPVLTVKLD